jgi:protein O-GlcNAc transferase
MGKASRRRHAPPGGSSRAPGDHRAMSGLELRARQAVARGDHDGALLLYGQAAGGGSTSADTHSDLGVLLAMKGQGMAAVVQFERALSLEPGHRNARTNLVKALESVSLPALRAGRWADAAAGYVRLAALDPTCATFHHNAGAALCALEQPERAMAFLERAAALDPGSASTQYNLGVALMAMHHPDCEGALMRALELSPDYWDAHVNLGMVRSRMGQFDAAEDGFRHVLDRQPDHLGANLQLAALLRDLGRLTECLAQTRRASDLLPELSVPASDYLLARQSDPTATGPDLRVDAQAWAARFADPLASTSISRPPAEAGGARPATAAFPERDRSPNRRLRVGYVSADFHNHSVARFIEPLLGAHDPAQVEVVVYAQGLVDETTRRLRGLVPEWHDTTGLDDAALAQQIARHRIDVLVDLGGHTGCNRLLAFARRPAPVQVTYCGYPGTTGLSTMDWRLTDAIADPDSEGDTHATERLWRLPHGFLCFRADPDSPPVSAPPSMGGGVVTFGSFNNLAKIGPEVLALWARVLAAVPGARLFMKSRALGDRRPRERVTRIFEQHGVDPSRLDFVGYAPATVAHLGLYARVDVGLDPFPYNGTTTTCEALWMGVPVVTMLGHRHAGRVGASLLDRVGLDDLVARDPDHYLDVAVRLAADRGRLERLRADLRGRMASSTLMSPSTLARDIEDAYRHFWRSWTASTAVETLR